MVLKFFLNLIVLIYEGFLRMVNMKVACPVSDLVVIGQLVVGRSFPLLLICMYVCMYMLLNTALFFFPCNFLIEH